MGLSDLLAGRWLPLPDSDPWTVEDPSSLWARLQQLSYGRIPPRQSLSDLLGQQAGFTLADGVNSTDAHPSAIAKATAEDPQLVDSSLSGLPQPTRTTLASSTQPAYQSTGRLPDGPITPIRPRDRQQSQLAPGGRDGCVDSYVRCQDAVGNWRYGTGYTCSDCLHYCTTQGFWPIHLCPHG